MEVQTATPETGTVTPAPNPNIEAGLERYSDPTERDFVRALRVRQQSETTTQAPQEATQETTQQDEPQSQALAEDEAEAEPDAVAEAEESTPEEPIELPDSFDVDALAEALDLKPEDLLAKLKVKTDDGELSLDELRKGHLREADYTRKTQKLAKDKEAIEAHIRQRDTELKGRETFLENALAVLAVDLNAGPSDQDLIPLLDPHSGQYDPNEYHRLRALRDGKLQRFNQVAQHIEANRKQTEDVRVKALAEHRKEQQAALLRAKPDLKDASSRTGFNERMVEGLTTEFGFKPEEVRRYFDGAFDHRHILMIEDAMKYRELQKAKGKMEKVATLPKVKAPGASKPAPTASDKAQKLRERLRKSGSADDMIALLKLRSKSK
jgi:hypothetical protein